MPKISKISQKVSQLEALMFSASSKITPNHISFFLKSHDAISPLSFEFRSRQNTSFELQFDISSALTQAVNIQIALNNTIIYTEQIELNVNQPKSVVIASSFSNSNSNSQLLSNHTLSICQIPSTTLENIKLKVVGQKISKKYNYSQVDSARLENEFRLLSVSNNCASIYDFNDNLLHSIPNITALSKICLFKDYQNTLSLVFLHLTSNNSLVFSQIEGNYSYTHTIASNVCHFAIAPIESGFRVFYIKNNCLFYRNIIIASSLDISTEQDFSYVLQGKKATQVFFLSNSSLSLILLNVFGGVVVINAFDFSVISSFSFHKIESAFLPSLFELKLYYFDENSCINRKTLSLSTLELSPPTKIRYCDSFIRVSNYSDWFIDNGVPFLMSTQDA